MISAHCFPFPDEVGYDSCSRGLHNFVIALGLSHFTRVARTDWLFEAAGLFTNLENEKKEKWGLCVPKY